MSSCQYPQNQCGALEKSNRTYCKYIYYILCKLYHSSVINFQKTFSVPFRINILSNIFVFFMTKQSLMLLGLWSLVPPFVRGVCLIASAPSLAVNGSFRFKPLLNSASIQVRSNLLTRLIFVFTISELCSVFTVTYFLDFSSFSLTVFDILV